MMVQETRVEFIACYITSFFWRAACVRCPWRVT